MTIKTQFSHKEMALDLVCLRYGDDVTIDGATLVMASQLWRAHVKSDI